MKRNHWYVIDTPCFPARWKVVNDFYLMDNATYRYFKDEVEAHKEANKMNKHEINKMLV